MDTLQIVKCRLCGTEHTEGETTFHRDLVIGLEGMHNICNTHKYVELAFVEADCE
jgi:hypothetical protein